MVCERLDHPSLEDLWLTCLLRVEGTHMHHRQHCSSFVTDFYEQVLVPVERRVTLLNYSQTRERRFPDRDARQLELSWAEWLYSRRRGRPQVTSFSDEESDEPTG
jgi:hypothetical protein